MSTSDSAPKVDATAEDAAPQGTQHYWLPEVVHLHLTALEAGWLTAVVMAENNAVRVNKPDKNGLPIPSTIREIILEKLDKDVQKFYRKVPAHK